MLLLHVNIHMLNKTSLSAVQLPMQSTDNSSADAPHVVALSLLPEHILFHHEQPNNTLVFYAAGLAADHVGTLDSGHVFFEFNLEREHQRLYFLSLARLSPETHELATEYMRRHLASCKHTSSFVRVGYDSCDL